MSKLRELETVFFFFGFRKCTNNETINFLKKKENHYLVFRVFNDRVADLLYEEYQEGENPCNSKPINDKTIKLGFEINNDMGLLREVVSRDN